MKKLFPNLRRWSQNQRLAVSFFITILAAVALIPLWLWNQKYRGIQIKETQAENSGEELLISGQVNFPNPIVEVDKQLREQVTEPVKIKTVTTVDEDLVILFNVENTTFADLVLPTSNATLKDSDLGREYALIGSSTVEGRPLVPLVSPGQTYEGTLYFPKVFNGPYYLHLPNLKYQDDGQSEFEQIIKIEVTDAYLPRT